MKKYNVSYSEILHYLTQEIEANNEDDAKEKFLELFENEDLPVNKSETYHFEIEEIKPKTKEMLLKEIDEEAIVIFEHNGWGYAKLFLESKGLEAEDIEAFHEKVMKTSDDEN